MANIQIVDYEAIPGKASQMRGEGQNLNNEIISVYQSIGEMHNSWYGIRYNELVKLFNNLIPTIDSLLNLVVGEIPFALETVANNYSYADRGSAVVGANKTPANKIPELAITSDVGMKFVTGEVETIQTKVANSFSKAVDSMNSIESTYNSVNWQSEAAESFKAAFNDAKNKIVEGFNEINANFKTLMSQTVADIESAESANKI